MLKLRAEQLEAMRQAVVRRFHARVADHLRARFPAPCERLGDGLGREIEDGIERARMYGYVSEKQGVRFLELCFTYGRDFDTRVPAAIDLILEIDTLRGTGPDLGELAGRLADAEERGIDGQGV